MVNQFATVIMAAGKGTRMKSDLAKVLHPVNGRPMVHYVIDLAEEAGSEKTILVIGHQKEKVMGVCQERKVLFAVQEPQLGTGHAVQMAEAHLTGFTGDVMVLSGDVPLLTIETIKKLLTAHHTNNAIATLLTAELHDPTGYGRVIRNLSGKVTRIVEHKDASEEEKKINEINVGIYVFKAEELFQTLKLIKNDNVQGEYYLPDVVKLYVGRGEIVVAQLAANFDETRGINTIEQLKAAETILLSRR
jgi:UDP-N-acetylglucosamine diphosphorylase/glucosamine-1-phosphate N-acetyltransferase